MKECFIIYNYETHRVYSESEFTWSNCCGTFYESQAEARAVMDRDKLDLSKVGTIHLYNY